MVLLGLECKYWAAVCVLGWMRELWWEKREAGTEWYVYGFLDGVDNEVGQIPPDGIPGAIHAIFRANSAGFSFLGSSGHTTVGYRFLFRGCCRRLSFVGCGR
jgi:hypothetical protein